MNGHRCKLVAFLMILAAVEVAYELLILMALLLSYFYNYPVDYCL